MDAPGADVPAPAADAGARAAAAAPAAAVDPAAAALSELFGADVEVVERRASSYRSTHALDELVVVAGGDRHELVLKGGGPLAGLDRIRPRLVRDAEREAWAYRAVLPDVTGDAPRFHGLIAVGTADERLVLEKVAGSPLTDVGDRDVWLAAARWLGAFHARGRAVAGSADAAAGRLLEQTPALHRRWWARALRRARALGSASPRCIRRAPDRRDTTARIATLGPAYAKAVDHLAGTPATLLHGEFYPSNIMIETRLGRVRTRPIDWESIGRGPALLDLAALTIGDWTEAERADFRSAWAAAAGVAEPPVRKGLEAARLVNAMQWLGWTLAWNPPPQHARDWLAEAEDAAGRFLALAPRT